MYHIFEKQTIFSPNIYPEGSRNAKTYLKKLKNKHTSTQIMVTVHTLVDICTCNKYTLSINYVLSLIEKEVGVGTKPNFF